MLLLSFWVIGPYLVIGFDLFRVCVPLNLIMDLKWRSWTSWALEPVIASSPGIVRLIKGKKHLSPYFWSLELGLSPMIWDCDQIVIKANFLCSVGFSCLVVEHLVTSSRLR